MKKILNKKLDKGITLIALVITIVVLLILTAIAINLTLGDNGIFKRAKTAKAQYQNAEDYEKSYIEILDGDKIFTSSYRENGANSTMLTITVTNITGGTFKINVNNVEAHNFGELAYYVNDTLVYKGTDSSFVVTNINGQPIEDGKEYEVKVITRPYTIRVTTDQGDNVNSLLATIGRDNIEGYTLENIDSLLDNTQLLTDLLNSSAARDYLGKSTQIIFPKLISRINNNSTLKSIIKSNAIKIPNMTSNTAPSGTASASQVYNASHSSWCAFTGFWTDSNIQNYGRNDGYYDNNKAWTTPNNSTQYPAWLQYKFPDGTDIAPAMFEYMSSYSWGYGTNHSIKIQGSKDGTNWFDLTENISTNAYTKYEIYPTKNIDKYQYYRLNVLSKTETYGSRTDVLIFQVYGL